MSAGPNAKPVGELGKWMNCIGEPIPIEEVKRRLKFRCTACGNTGNATELLAEDDDSTMWCPLCGTASWEWI